MINPGDLAIAVEQVLKENDCWRDHLKFLHDTRKKSLRQGKSLDGDPFPKGLAELIKERNGYEQSIQDIGRALTELSRTKFYQTWVEFVGGDHEGVGWNDRRWSIPPDQVG